jgi:uncharacterized metal-binding protein/predicted Fe-Mo cluster-binding NifX family protein
MRYGIPLFAERIAPRCTAADSLLIVETQGGRETRAKSVRSPGASWPDLISVLVEEGIDALVCGGISQPARQELQERGIAVVNNVVATAEAAVEAILEDRLQPGFGLAMEGSPSGGGVNRAALDCLSCTDRTCLSGSRCPLLPRRSGRLPRAEWRRILEATADISSERERVLCRLSELVYFGLETGCRRLGLAFCWDLLEPARILAGVLRRFFEVVPVGCRVGGTPDGLASGLSGGGGARDRLPACDPVGQARALAAASCQLNVTVGLCVGADCLFSKASKTMVTTLVVKDRSLAHNPVAALYSERYLKEALLTSSQART